MEVDFPMAEYSKVMESTMPEKTASVVREVNGQWSALDTVMDINDILATHTYSLEFSDDTNALVTGKNPEDLQLRLSSACTEIGSWCRNRRTVVYGPKTDLMLLIGEASAEDKL